MELQRRLFRVAVFLIAVLMPCFFTGTSAHANDAEDAAGSERLPLKELRAPSPSLPVLTLLLAGDGGWAKIDRDISAALNRHGMDVLGFNSPWYFLKGRSPEGCATDIGELSRHYLRQWNKKTIVMIGFSRGADVLPFIVSRFPDDLKQKIRLIVLLSPSTTASFRFHVIELVGVESKNPHYPLVPEVAKLSPLPVVCFCGNQEEDSLCKEPAAACSKIMLLGRHHFNHQYDAMGERIWREYEKRNGGASPAS